VPALICISCIKDLSKALKFRHKCRETDDFFKKSTYEIESLIWNGTQDELIVASGSQNSEDVTVKDETSEDPRIKDEPFDDFNIGLFENIDTILEERIERSEQSSLLTGIFNRTKKEISCSESSESDSECEEAEGSRLSKSSRRLSDYADFEVG